MNSAQGVGISNREAVVGVTSMILWTLTLIVTLKYVTVLLRLDNKGEGGTFALMALGQSVAKRSAPLILGLGIAGAAFFMETPSSLRPSRCCRRWRAWSSFLRPSRNSCCRSRRWS